MSDNVSLKDTNNQLEDRGQNPFDNLEFETFGQSETPSILVPGYRWKMDALPTVDPAIAGMLWNDSGIVRVSGLGSLPTSDPGVTGELWNSGGQVVLSGYTAPNPIPVGAYFPYAGSTAPAGYLLFSPGATIGDTSSTATYKSAAYETLFNICKASWNNAGTEAWASHHKVFLPDPTAASLVGVGTSIGFTTNETIAQGVKVNDQYQGHNHTLYGSNGSAGGSSLVRLGTSLLQNFSVTTSNVSSLDGDAGYGAPRRGTTTHGKYLGTYYIIKY